MKSVISKKVKVGIKFKDIKHPNDIFVITSIDEDVIKVRHNTNPKVSTYLHPEYFKESNEDSVFFVQNEIIIGSCDHDLKQYIGFTDTYNYCTKCKHKE